jgi:acyl carrier protein phosphodiesterase
LGDFIKGPLTGKLPAQIELGIKLHRQLDAWSNQHAEFSRAAHLLRPEHRRIAPVVVDVLLDHFLARHWPAFCQQSLGSFTRQFYQQMDKLQPHLPTPAKRWLAASREVDLLARYADVEFLGPVFERMEARRGRALGLPAAFEDAKHNYRELEAKCLELLTLCEEQSLTLHNEIIKI